MARILIVEDAEVDRAVAQALVDGMDGMDVESVANGEEALASIAVVMPDLVVTDLIMPVVDGLELVSAVVERYPLLPVVIMTSRGSEEVAVQALEEGAASYVPKHALAELLPETIERVLSASQQRRGRAHLMQVVQESRSSFVLGNDRALFRPLIQFLQDAMAEFGLFDEMERTRVGVAIEEALNNAAEHGNLELDSALRDEDMAGYLRLMQQRVVEKQYRDRKIRIEASFSPREAVFEIEDDGPGFDPSVDPATTLESTSGRGLMLMRMFMDEVAFNARGNRVRMTKRTTTPAGGAAVVSPDQRPADA